MSSSSFPGVKKGKTYVMREGLLQTRLTLQKRKEGQTCQTAVNEHAPMHPAGDAYPERAQN